MGNGLSSYFPLYLHEGALHAGNRENDQLIDLGDGALLLFQDSQSASSEFRDNLSGKAKKYLDVKGGSASQLFYHVVAILNDNLYRQQNADTLRLDWPRIPLPPSFDLLSVSAELGKQVADLLDTEAQIDSVTAGKIRPELRLLGTLRRLGEAPLDLGLTARWGYAGQKGVTMPGRGDARERGYTDDELAVLADAAATRGLLREDMTALLGETTYDIFLNDTAYWSNVPARVWNYSIGGYQVIKKWLSYREQPLLERPLKPEEARYVTEMVRRIAALLLLEPALDDNYRAVAAAARNWTA
jgi:hypothetical protein